MVDNLQLLVISSSKIRKVLFFLFIIVLGVKDHAHSQFLEFGGGIGVTNYSGDINPGYHTDDVHLAYTFFHRMNFSEIVSVKYAITFGKISSSDELPFDALAANRDASFSRPLVEGSLVFEYNFLDFKHEHSPIRWSPYVFGGVGFTRMFGERTGDYSMMQPVIPFGLGFKQLVGKKFALGLEVGLRRTFFDEWDNVSDGNVEFKDYQYGNPNTNDWYTFAGLSVSYIIYKIPCPFRYVPNQSIYR